MVLKNEFSPFSHEFAEGDMESHGQMPKRCVNVVGKKSANVSRRAFSASRLCCNDHA